MNSRNGSEIRLLFASDLHGSNVCFWKLIRLAEEIGVDAVALAGDLTGKDLYIVEPKDGVYIAKDSRGSLCLSAQELEVARKAWADVGIYSVVLEREGPIEEDAYEQLIEEAKIRRLRQWLTYASDKFQPKKRALFVIPGNDDSPTVAEFLGGASHDAICVDEKIVTFFDHEIFGLGYSTPTPWHTFREIGENEIEEKLCRAAARLTDIRRAIFLIHVPPFGSGLDTAPELITESDGSLAVVPGYHKEAGSTAVSKFIKEREPLLVASGHCHDSPGFRKIGKTLCINPGSSYHTGTLNAALVILAGREIVGYQALMR